ncbi:LuxR C-terminal-related transcriptional regulator [Urechidicola croceus]|uniref:HTH luxR-type domain-containing protein n=1 Tax=Urechidicola croceus TaxID=1850246 RepID=A0A1D8P4Q3_9FLAO|nr:LuxR C-terminal-related transcriptional regulator [Urechidicola croceus]AOW19582.1 hypothetical protein LPB138_02320 [Urechidicola croceus]
MNFNQKLCLLLLLFCSSIQYGQFQFSVEVNNEFDNSTAYLSIVDDYKKSFSFLTEKIIQEAKIDSLGNFIFKGDFLSDENKFYKIHIDKCNDNITDSNHLLDHCEDSQEILFIANNTDYIHFPLNNFEQMLCALQYSRPQNIAIHKIDSVQETLLLNLQDSKSDIQRQAIYTNYFKKIKDYSQSFNEPLAELYSFNIYSDEKSFSRNLYIHDLKTSKYYESLLKKMEKTYPNSNYTLQFKADLKRDNYKPSSSKYSTILIGVLGLLLASITLNIYLLKFKNKKSTSRINYKEVLSPQEQKVFELMHQKMANKEIANSLFISVSTVKTHINNIYSKLSISSRNEMSQFF